MNFPSYRRLLWVGLGLMLTIFYVTFLTARTYYNPVATALIIILGGFISIGGIISSRLPGTHRGSVFESLLFSRIRAAFPVLFILALLTLAADVLLTLYAVSNFGTGIEANKVVAELIQRGAVLAWLGQQFGPILITGVVFGLTRNVYLRTMAAFFTLGTLGYAVATVLNDIIVIRALILA